MHKLNPQQVKAVEYIDGPLLVIAGAGSGKTSVITEKVAYLIKKCSYNPSNILAVTFTNKAAKEMRERVSSRLDKKETRGLQISTFHTLGLEILKKNYKDIGYKKNFSLFDAEDSLTLIQSIANEKEQITKQEAFIIQNKISLWKNSLISPKDLEKICTDNSPDYGSYIVYKNYQKNLKLYNAVDFDDLISIPVYLITNNPSVKEYWNNKFRYILIDEYQDTNESQYRLMKLLANGRNQFTVVGDDDQSIYAWRGARPENLTILSNEYPLLKVIKLEQNYRSTGCILNMANMLIANNSHLFTKNLWSSHSYGDHVRIITTKDENDEAQTIISDIITDKIKGNNKDKDYAILVRGNHQTFLLERFCQMYRLQYNISGGSSFFAKMEIKDILAYCRLIINLDDDAAFLRIVNTPKREIGSATIEKLSEYASKRNIPLFLAVDEIGLHSHLKATSIEKLQRFSSMILKYKNLITKNHDLSRENLHGYLLEMIDTINYKQWLIGNSSSIKQAEKRFDNVKQICDWICDKDNKSDEKIDFAEIINKMLLSDIIERNKTKGDDNKVQILTVHSSKGLEFKNLYIMGFEDGLIPHQQSIESDSIEEERRIAYVAITRAQKNLTFTLTKHRNKYGTIVPSIPSRFIKELPAQDIEWSGMVPETAEEKRKKTKENIAFLKSQFKGD